MGSPPRHGPLAGILVLVVDDDEDARPLLDSVLRQLGAFVATAGSAGAALNLLGEIQTDVVVCDANLGANDALWLTRQAQAHQPRTPFIAISAQDYDEDELQGAGFVGYIRKPVQQDDLTTAILKAMGR